MNLSVWDLFCFSGTFVVKKGEKNLFVPEMV